MKQIIFSQFKAQRDALDTMHALQTSGAQADELGVLQIPGETSSLLIVAAGHVTGEDVERQAMRRGGHRISAHDAAPALAAMMRDLTHLDDPYKAPETIVPEPLLSAVQDAVDRGEQPLLEFEQASTENKTSPQFPAGS